MSDNEQFNKLMNFSVEYYFLETDNLLVYKLL